MYLRLCARGQFALSGLRDRLMGQRGATAVEYAIMLAFIFVVIVSAVAFLGRSVNSQFSTVQFPP
jgi:pilus assembly protein Flp/PilA